MLNVMLVRNVVVDLMIEITDVLFNLVGIDLLNALHHSHEAPHHGRDSLRWFATFMVRMG